MGGVRTIHDGSSECSPTCTHRRCSAVVVPSHPLMLATCRAVAGFAVTQASHGLCAVCIEGESIQSSILHETGEEAHLCAVIAFDRMTE